MKKKIGLLIGCALFVILAVGSVGGNDSKSDSNSDTNNASTEKKVVTYEKITAKQLVSDLEGNAFKAAHKGKDYEITGVLGNIDAQGDYVTIEPSGDDLTLTGVQAFVKNDDQKKAIAELSKGDKITIKGKVKDVGEVMGYSVDIDEISKATSKK